MAVAFAVVTTAGVAHAQDDSGEDGLGQFVVGAGVFDALDDDATPAAEFEWRPNFRMFDFVTPLVGGLVTTEGSAMGYAGIGIELELGDSFVVMPFTSAGVYVNGGGQDLGSAVEFRSGVEASYRFDEQSSVGLAFSHISNAGISEDNPGSEQVMLRYSFTPD